MTIFRLALASLRNRWLTALLTVIAIAVSVMLLLGVDKLRTSAKASFANTISGTDLIVGARSGGLQLLLYSVFRIGNATNNMTWRSFEDIKRRPEVAWIVPLSLGDSHRGFRVLGTTPDYFKYYRFRQDRQIEFAAGKPFADLFDAVIGADVAKALQYKIGDEAVVAHGSGRIAINKHDDKPFRISGILKKTGTPLDRTVHVSLAAIEAIHVDWRNGVKDQNRNVSIEAVRKMELRPTAITAALVGLRSKLATFKLQQYVNTYRAEPLSAILPGLTLYELWGLVGTAETALTVVSVMVVITAILGMMTMILATLNERRREIAILRSVGAGPGTIVGLLVSEATMLCGAGVLLGLAATYAALLALRPLIDDWYGLYLNIDAPTSNDGWMLFAIVAAGALAGLLPAMRAYRQSLADGMAVRS